MHGPVCTYRRALSPNKPLRARYPVSVFFTQHNVDNYNVEHAEDANFDLGNNVNFDLADHPNVDLGDNANFGNAANENNSNDNNANGDNDVNLEDFISNLCENVEIYAALLYAIPSVTRKLVDNIISYTSELISNSVSLLKKCTMHILSKFPEMYDDFHVDVQKLTNMFEVIGNPFEFMSTEYRRLCTLAEKGVYIKPEPFEMGHVDKYIQIEGRVQLVRSPVYGYTIPLREVLQQFLQRPGVLEEILNFMNSLQNVNGRVSHFLQGHLWERMQVSHGDKLVLPLVLDFDDYEPNNALGSHANEQSLGALYVRLQCLPPDSSSQLDNIFLFSLFESKYHKEFGNAVAFASSISELKFLLEEGLIIVVGERNQRVYFCLCAVQGDNKGINHILGFLKGFRGNYFCRFCKMHWDVTIRWCRPVPAELIRNTENYDVDVARNDSRATGIHEQCVFNELPGFHCLSNSTCDVMHTVFEGMLKYGICNILSHLVNRRGYFSIETLIDRVKGFDFGPNEVGNKPPTCKFSASSLSDCSLNLSAAEWLCLGRSLGIMIGDLVQETNQVWRLYVIINEIILICSSPFYEVGVENYLLRLVQDHHELYTRFFGDLKPKHHLMLHYAEHFKNFGPLTAFSALLSERNHRRGKLYARVCNSRINLALTCAIKFQLYLAERLMRPDGRQLIVHTKCKRVLLASLAYHAMFAHLLPFPDNMLHTVDRVEVKGTIYVPKAVLVVGVGADLPLLGKIIYNIMHNDGVVFVVQMYKVVGYLEHVCAYEVEDGDQWCCLRHENVRYYDPLHLRTTSDGKKVVGLTYSL
ncbi:uncharacterized protein LOC127750137 [Frankliniella occidentalis]|uniref:Uncharacterized protein LOC127750137 n=1 Tax=Frankliniella occidentalis TaxID=133901 RepID=A0A9C6U3K6_FRAOC|nr:uncharacterized protein LOC127750137 [Frankliniella occidentalis]